MPCTPQCSTSSSNLLTNNPPQSFLKRIIGTMNVLPQRVVDKRLIVSASGALYFAAKPAKVSPSSRMVILFSRAATASPKCTQCFAALARALAGSHSYPTQSVYAHAYIQVSGAPIVIVL